MTDAHELQNVRLSLPPMHGHLPPLLPYFRAVLLFFNSREGDPLHACAIKAWEDKVPKGQARIGFPTDKGAYEKETASRPVIICS
jgi:hypothetical protein